MTATILVVDDLEPNIKLLEAKLLKYYYTVFTANSGPMALDILAQERIDIVLLDVMMPGMDGFEVCKLIKSNPNTMHIPVVMVTALSEEIEGRIRALEAGADEFLTKPINDVELLARVKSLARIRADIAELQMRNETNTELGGRVVDFRDNFTESKILIINDDVIQSKNIAKTIFRLTYGIKILTNLDEIDMVVAALLPDVVIISCQIKFADPLRIVVKLRGISELKHSSFMLLAEEEDTDTVTTGLEIGVNDYFIYPVDENELLARIKTQLRRKKYQDELRQDIVNLAIKDGLTGIFNRRYFDTHIEQIVTKSNTNQKPFCLLMIDVDHFKKVNDCYGHQAGDKALQNLTKIVKEQIKVTDLFARYGGEEFVIALRDISINDAKAIAERLRSAVVNAKFDIGTEIGLLHNTISIGLAEYQVGESTKSLIKRADKALFKAKNSGRNKVIVTE